MAPRGHPDDEITGYTGWVGPGGSVSLWPVRVRDRYGRGGGCCAGVLALVVLGIVAAWLLGRVVARPKRGLPTGGAAGALQHWAASSDVRPAAVAGFGTARSHAVPGARGVSYTSVACGCAREGVA